MCIAFFTVSHPGYKLILASNRDEFLHRPTLPAGWHDFAPGPAPCDGSCGAAGAGKGEGRVLSGLDRGKAEGGTWLGVTRDLKVGLLTNVRLTPPKPPIKPLSPPPSRGLLLKTFLSAPLPAPSSSSSSNSTLTYITSHLPSAGDYEGFNLLLFSLSSPTPEVGYFTNRPEPRVDAIGVAEGPRGGGVRGCVGISNSPMGEPWPKVLEGEKRMAESLNAWEKAKAEEGGKQAEKDLVERMFGVLSQSIPINGPEDMLHSTQIPPIKLGADLFLNVDPADTLARWSGTRTSTVVLVKDNGETVFVERDILELDESGEARKGTGERWFEFQGELKA
ncbi:hypothetical protein IAT38_007867 [Cryptococcus sp. DSM 104549]